MQIEAIHANTTSCSDDVIIDRQSNRMYKSMCREKQADQN